MSKSNARNLADIIGAAGTPVVTSNASFSANVAVTGITTLSSNVVLGTTTITANGGVGTSGQVLTSGATSNAYWSTPAGFSNGQSISVANVAISNTITFADSTAMSTAPVGFKNRIINGDFRIWQRGTSFSGVASGQYTADRWQLSYRTAGVTIAQQNNTSYYGARLTNTDGSAQSFDFEQRIEDVTQFNNAVFMLSFYAKSSTSVTGNMNCYVNYGSGGSSQDTATYSSAFSVTTTRTKFTIPITFPNMSAKTVGTSNYVRLLFTPVNLPASAWIEFDSVQLEAGATATPFEFRPQGLELSLCQRYYEQDVWSAVAVNTNGSNINWQMPFKVTKRTTPTVTSSGTVTFQGIVAGVTVTGASGTVDRVEGSASRSGTQADAYFATSDSGGWKATAEL
jgi:hypothetical protein